MKPVQKHLNRYLKAHQLSQTQFAKKIGVAQGVVSMWLRDKVGMTPYWVLEVEKKTGGELSRYDLRPDVYPRDSV
jgi:DNA-binding transcriptional regulator YdaS (Cro superfamily)